MGRHHHGRRPKEFETMLVLRSMLITYQHKCLMENVPSPTRQPKKQKATNAINTDAAAVDVVS